VANRLDEPQDRDEVVIRNQILNRVEEDDALLTREQLFHRERQLLEVLRPDRILLADVAQPEDRDAGATETLPHLLRKNPRDRHPRFPRLLGDLEEPIRFV